MFFGLDFSFNFLAYSGSYCDFQSFSRKITQFFFQGRDSILNSSGMSSREKDCLSAMVRFCAVMATNFGDANIIRSHCLRLLSVLLEVESNLENPSILDIDALGLLVALTFSLPSLFSKDNAGNFPSGNVQDQHLLKLIYIVHLVQIMLTTDQFSNIMVGDYQYQKENQNDPKIGIRNCALKNYDLFRLCTSCFLGSTSYYPEYPIKILTIFLFSIYSIGNFA